MSFTLTSDFLNIRILAKGATLCDVRIADQDRNLVLGFKDNAQIPAYAGAIVGPVANRIQGGVMPIGGKDFQMPLNEANRTCLHSGPDGLHALDWHVIAQSPTQLSLGVNLADGDQGLPGLRQITATYSLHANTLRLEITAQTDQPTPMNIAHHPYWNLGGTDVAAHQLHINARQYLPTNALNLPTGQIAPVNNTMFDFTTPKPVPLSRALDVNYCLATKPHDQPKPCATLTGPDGTRLAIATTAPGVQVYAGGFLPALAGALQDGQDLRPFGGIALEPQFWPNAPHHPDFPSINLHPGEVWRQITTYTLSNRAVQTASSSPEKH